MAYIASKLRELVNSMGNHFILLKKPVLRVNQRRNPSGTEIDALMLHFLWLSYFMAKTNSKFQKIAFQHLFMFHSP